MLLKVLRRCSMLVLNATQAQLHLLEAYLQVHVYHVVLENAGLEVHVLIVHLERIKILLNMYSQFA